MSEVTSIVAIRYQVFFLDPTAEIGHQLSAIRPAFATPAAVDALSRTVKYENKKMVVVIGSEAQIEEFLKRCQRLDLTDWLPYGIEDKAAALRQLAEERGLATTDDLSYFGGGIHRAYGEEVEAKAKGYPVDLPLNRREIWDAAGEQFRTVLQVGHKNSEVKLAIHRLVYEKLATKLGIIPWTEVTRQGVDAEKQAIRMKLIKGESEASKVADRLEAFLLDKGLIKKMRSQRFLAADWEPNSKRLYIAHRLPILLLPEPGVWENIVSAIIRDFSKQQPFSKGRDALSSRVDNGTTIFVERPQGGATDLRILQYLTEEEAKVLTGEVESDRLPKALRSLVRRWYKTGKFPEVV